VTPDPGPNPRREVLFAVVGTAIILGVLFVLVPATLTSVSAPWAIGAALVAGFVLATAPSRGKPEAGIPAMASSRVRLLFAITGGLVVFGISATAVAQSPTYTGSLVPLYLAAAMLAALVAVVAAGTPDRRQQLGVALAVLVLGMTGLGATIVYAATPPGGCPAALWQGRVFGAALDGLGGIVPSAPEERFILPFGEEVRDYRPTPDAGVTGVLTDLLGNELLRSGETVAISGGETTPGVWRICGPIRVLQSG